MATTHSHNDPTDGTISFDSSGNLTLTLDSSSDTIDLSSAITVSGITNLTGNIVYSGNNWTTSGYFYNATPSIPELSKNFAKYTKHISEEDLEKMLNSMKEEEEDLYLSSLRDLLKHFAFRQLSEKFLLERITDIESIEEKSDFRLTDYYDLDKYPSVKLLKKIR